MAERAFTHAGIEPERVRRVGTAAAFQRSRLLQRRINDVMREGRRGRTAGEEIPFFCECQRTDCYEPMWLTAAVYDERRTEGQRPLTLPGHENGRAEGTATSALLRGLSSKAGRTRAAGNGAKTRDEIRCESCGYGAVVDRKPPQCPMCGNESWIVVVGAAEQSTQS